MSELEDLMAQYVDTQESEEELQDEGAGRKQAQDALKQYHKEPAEEPKGNPDLKVFVKAYKDSQKQNQDLRKELDAVKKDVQLAKYYAEQHEKRNIISDVTLDENGIVEKPHLKKYFDRDKLYAAITKEGEDPNNGRILKLYEKLAIDNFEPVAKELYELKQQIKEEEEFKNHPFGGQDYSRLENPDKYKSAIESGNMKDVFRIAKGQ